MVAHSYFRSAILVLERASVFAVSDEWRSQQVAFNKCSDEVVLWNGVVVFIWYFDKFNKILSFLFQMIKQND